MSESSSINQEIASGSERPLITFLLLSYNQEKFIREAVEGAFAQTYSPLEILLSDDCSADRTFEIMAEMAADYQGPHTIILNRNPKNLGIGAHFNRAAQIAKGELIVAAAGDDLSLPERTTLLCDAWVASGAQAFSLFSDALFIDESGKELQQLYSNSLPVTADTVEAAVKKGGVGLPGCTHMFSRKTFEIFGPMDDQVMAEDMVIPFRSLILGRIAYVNQPLVKYRTHEGNISIESAGRPSLQRRSRDKVNQEAVYLTWLKDVRAAQARELLSEARVDLLKNSIFRLMQIANIEKQSYRKGLVSAVFFLFGSLFNTATASLILKIVERRIRNDLF